MIELQRDSLLFSFPEVHRHAQLRVEFHRTLRIPDDGRDYPLPPGLGSFPLRHVDDHAGRLPDAWKSRGGVMLPMFQSEAMWIGFSSPHGYPFAVKVAAGKIDAVTGKGWDAALHDRPQDYLAVPEQPWLDGFCVGKGVVRQFVAMPLGEGYTAEEQLTGEAEHGGIQLIAYPLRRELYREWPREPETVIQFASAPSFARGIDDLGLAPGGRMRQEIYAYDGKLADWDASHSSRCFVHLANSLAWRAITGEAPPTLPPTAAQYTAAGLPWFEYYGEGAALDGSPALGKLASVAEVGAQKGEAPLPENESTAPGRIWSLGRQRRRRVREAAF
jgi:hypothetical protein